MAGTTNKKAVQMIEIMRPGVDPESYTRYFGCTKCGCEIKCNNSDVKSYAWARPFVECPNCKGKMKEIG